MDSAFAKLGRAKAHLGTLQDSMHAYRNLDDAFDYSREVIDHPFDASLVIIRFRLQVRRPPPDDWGLIVGDILSNLRAALDHAVYGHAEARAHSAGTPLTPKQRRALQYPFVHKGSEWPNERGKLEPFMDGAVIDEIEKTQPFKNIKSDWHSFALLNRLVNQDKHRTVRVVSYVNEVFNIAPGTEAEIVSIDDAPREMVDGIVVAQATVRRPLRRPGSPPGDVFVPFNVQFGYTENIDLPEVGSQKGALLVMEVLVDHVGKVLRNLKNAGC